MINLTVYKGQNMYIVHDEKQDFYATFGEKHLRKMMFFTSFYNTVDTCQRIIVSLMGNLTVGEFNDLTDYYKWQV